MKRRLFVLLAVIFSIMALFSGCVDTTNPSGNSGGGGGGDTPPEETSVKNLRYNEQKLQFEWDEVEDATKYEVRIYDYYYNESTNEYVRSSEYVAYNTGETSFFYTPDDFKMSVRILPKYDDYNKTSVLSHEYMHTFDTLGENSLLVDAYLLLNTACLTDLDRMKEIVSIRKGEDYFVFYGVSEVDGVDRFCKTSILFDTPINSIGDIIAKVDDADSYVSFEQLAPFDCADILLESGEFVGEMQAFKDQGYEFEIVSSATIKDSNYETRPSVYLNTIYRITKGDDVKYISTRIESRANNPAAYIESDMSAIVVPESRTLSEKEFQVLEGEFAEFAQQLYQANKG